jgi:thiamine pyrophosphate-dependent acetolactate synthase large subunit-like protein
VNSVDLCSAVLEARPDALYVASLGTATSALRAASDDGPHFYFGGAMACALGFALGVAERKPDREVVCLLGDGELLMSAGSLWSLAGLSPPNLLTVVLDNHMYGITGRQQTVTEGRFADVAAALPSLTTSTATTTADIHEQAGQLKLPALVHATVEFDGPPGPSPFVEPDWVLPRFAVACGVTYPPR